MKYIITGSRGFIGTRLCEELKRNNIPYIGLDSRNGDISSESYYSRVIASEHDIVIHLAGKSYVPDSWSEPVIFHAVNVLGTINTLEFCKKYKLGIIFLSSYLYGNPRYFPIDERHPLGLNNPYALSKKMAEDAITFYGKNHGIAYNILRPFNIYGKGQDRRFLIPTIIEQVKDEKTDIIKLQDLRPKRDYIHVMDVVKAIIASSKRLNNDIYNVAYGSSSSVEDITLTILRIYQSSKRIEGSNTSRKNEIIDCYGDFSKIKLNIGWQPVINIYDGIKEYM